MLKRILSTVLAVTVIMSCIAVVPVFAEGSFSTETVVLYSNTFDNGTSSMDTTDGGVKYTHGTMLMGKSNMRSTAFDGNEGIQLDPGTWATELLTWTQDTNIADGKVAIEFDMAISSDRGVIPDKSSNNNSVVKVNDKTFLEYRETNGIHFAYIDVAKNGWHVDSNNPVVPEDGVLYKTGLYMDLDNDKLYTVINGRNLYTNNLPADFAFSKLNITASKTFQYFDNLKITYYPASTGSFAVTAPANMYNSTDAITVNFAEPVLDNLTTANFSATVGGAEAAIEKVEKVSAYQAKIYFADLKAGTYTITPANITGISGATAASTPVSVVVADWKMYDLDYDNISYNDTAKYVINGTWDNDNGNFSVSEDESGNITLVNSDKSYEWKYTLANKMTAGGGIIKVSFDAKTTKVDSEQEYVRLWFNRASNNGQNQYIFGLKQNNNGENVVIGKGEWANKGTNYTVDAADAERAMHSYEVTVNMNTKKYYIVVDGVSKENGSMQDNAEINQVVFETRAGIAEFDNLQIFALDSGVAGFANDAEAVAGASTIVLESNSAIDTTNVTAGNFTVMQGTTPITVNSVAFDTSKTKATLTLASPFTAGHDYTVTTTGITTLGGIKADDTTVTVSCPPAFQIVSKDLEADGTVTFVIKNNTAGPIGVTLVAARFAAGTEPTPMTVADVSEKKTIAAGGTETLTAELGEGSGTVKAFLWNSIEDLVPYTGVQTF